MRICTIAINQPGGKIETRWEVRREHDYPCFSSSYTGGPLKVTNCENLLPGYRGGDPVPPAVQKVFHCNLLRSDNEIRTDTRLRYAGYDGNPGAFLVRGKSCGETSVKINTASTWGGVEIKVNGFDRPDKWQEKFYAAEIVPALQAFIAENAAGLLADAVAEMRARIGEQRKQVLESLGKCEKELTAAIDAAAKRG